MLKFARVAGSRMATLLATGAGGFVALSGSHPALAASPSARLVYSRSPEAVACPDESALRAAVSARFGYDPFFPWAPQAVVVHLGREPRDGALRYVAHLELVDPHGMSRGSRDLASNQRDCSELFDTTALALSIALDAASEGDPPPDDEPAAPSAQEPEPPPVEPAAEPPPEPPPPRGGPPEPAPPRAERGVFLGVDALGSIGLAPALTAGLKAAVGYRLELASLALEVRVDAPAGSRLSSGVGSVSSWMYAAMLVPCLHYEALAACALGALGAFQAAGADVSAPRSASARLVALGGRLSAEVPLTEAFALRLGVDLLVDLTRPTLVLDSLDVFRAPMIAAALFAGGQLRF